MTHVKQNYAQRRSEEARPEKKASASKGRTKLGITPAVIINGLMADLRHRFNGSSILNALPKKVRSMPLIGIVGGTFDPPHYAHLILAEHAREELDLDLVVFVPAGAPVHKTATRTPIEHRLAMLTLAIQDNPAFRLSRVDIDRPPPHYSVDMVRWLRSEYPDADFRFIMGEDSFRDLPTWHDPLQLVADGRVKLAVMRRPNVETTHSAMHESVLPGLAQHVLMLNSRMVEVSSSDIVRRLHEGKSVRYLLPDNVLAYIQEHGLYKDMTR